VNNLSGRISWADVGLALLLVGVALVVSRIRGAGLERDISVATLRSFTQLLAVGFVLDFVFAGHGALTPVVLLVMIGTATLTSGARGRRIPGAYWIAVTAVSVAAGSTLGDDLAAHRREVEAHLCLGETATEAAAIWHRAALRSGMLPTIDQTKVVGLVALPGAMTGMLLAGASASSAIRLQMVVMYMLLGGNAFAALVAGRLTISRLFTADHQLIRAVRRVAD